MLITHVFGYGPIFSLLIQFSCSIDFAAVHWEAANRNVMVLDDGTSITEAQLLFVGLFVLEPIFGVGFWKYFYFYLLFLARNYLVSFVFVISSVFA